MARLLVEIDEELKRDLKVRLLREGETLKEWIARMAEMYVEGGIPSARARQIREPQSGKRVVIEKPAPPPPAPTPATTPTPAPTAAPKKDDIFFFD